MRAGRAAVLLLAMTAACQLFIVYHRHYTGGGTLPSGPTRRWSPPPGTVIDLAGIPMKGNSSATIAIVGFSDFECKFCASHALGVAKELNEQLVATGEVRYGFMHNPVKSHRNAKMLGRSAVCAGEQGRFWEMHDLLFLGMPTAEQEVMPIVDEVSLNKATFLACLHGNDAAKRVEYEAKIAEGLGLKGVPNFAVGILNKEDRLTVTKFIPGDAPLWVFREVIDEANDVRSRLVGR